LRDLERLRKCFGLALGCGCFEASSILLQIMPHHAISCQYMPMLSNTQPEALLAKAANPQAQNEYTTP
jgi:hypothetical protein